MSPYSVTRPCNELKLCSAKTNLLPALTRDGEKFWKQLWGEGWTVDIFCQARSDLLTFDNCAETTNYIAWHRLRHTQKFVIPTSIIHIWVWHLILDYKQMVWWYYYLVYIYNEKNDKSKITHYEITDFSYYRYRYIIDDKQYVMTSSSENIFHVTGP